MRNLDHKATNKESYNQVARSYRARTEGEQKLLEDFTARLPQHGGDILDVGCGAGRDSRYFKEKGYDVVGVDNSEAMLAIAQSEDPSGRYQLMDFEDLSFQDESCNGVWANMSLHHVPKKDLPSILESIHRILKPSACLGIIVKHGNHDGYLESENSGLVVRRYFAYYERDELERLLTVASFKTVASLDAYDGEAIGLLGTRP